MPRIRLIAFALAAMLFAATAEAQTLYKLIDRNGKVTYSEEKPKNFDGQVIPLDIDPSRNTANLRSNAPKAGDGEPRAAPRARGKTEEGARGVDSAQRLQEARDRLEAARRALQDATENPEEGDVARVGNAKGGARPVPSPAYQKRLDRLEAEVKAAEENLRKAEDAAR